MAVNNKSIIVLQQATDEATWHKLLTPEEQKFNLYFNCLFSDIISVRLPDLLSNGTVYELLKNDVDIAPLMFGGEEPIFRPAIGDDIKESLEIAERMEQRQTPHNCGTYEDLKDHARRIDKERPRFLPFKHSVFRRDFAANTITVLNRLNKGYRFPGLKPIRKGQVGPLVKFLNNKINRGEEIYNGDIWGYIEDPSNGYREESIVVKILTHCMLHYTTAGLLKHASLSNLRILNDFVGFARSSTQQVTHASPQIFSEKLRLPLEPVADLPFRTIYNLRNSEPFEDVRGEFFKIRCGLTTPEPEGISELLSKKLVRCGELIIEKALSAQTTTPDRLIHAAQATITVLRAGAEILIDIGPAIPMILKTITGVEVTAEQVASTWAILVASNKQLSNLANKLPTPKNGSTTWMDCIPVTGHTSPQSTGTSNASSES